MVNEQDKQRIEKEAEDIVNTHYQNKLEGEAEAYADSVDRRGCSFWRGLKMGYIAGRGELERSEKLLQEYREVIKELLPIAEERLRRIVNYDMPDYHKVTGGIKSTIEKAKSLIEPKTDKA